MTKLYFCPGFIKIRCHFFMLSVDNFLIFILKPVLSAGCVAAPRSCHTPPPSLYLLFLNFPFIIYAFPSLLHTLWKFYGVLYYGPLEKTVSLNNMVYFWLSWRNLHFAHCTFTFFQLVSFRRKHKSLGILWGYLFTNTYMCIVH